MREITLDGIWDFFYSPQEFEAEKNTLPEIKEYCGKMLIPGYWDDHYELFDEEDFNIKMLNMSNYLLKQVLDYNIEEK